MNASARSNFKRPAADDDNPRQRRARRLCVESLVVMMTLVWTVGCDAYFKVEGSVVAGDRAEVVPLDPTDTAVNGDTTIPGAGGLAGVTVRFKHARGVRETTTDADGTFSVEGTTAHLRTAELEFRRQGFRTQQYRVAPPLQVPLLLRVTLVRDGEGGDAPGK